MNIEILRRIFRTRVFGSILPCLILAGLAISCHTTPYRRNLPVWIMRVYVPMAENQTFEPGLADEITTAFQEQILLDGRLSVASRGAANAVVQVTLENFSETPVGFTGDDIASTRQWSLMASINLFEPNDLENPFARVQSVDVTYFFDSNFRGAVSTLEADARRGLAEEAGRALLSSMMNNIEMLQE
ncbi:hypothetical protein HQ520_13785 [bacterium]|nr:hypothetical protein [bacterium]